MPKGLINEHARLVIEGKYPFTTDQMVDQLRTADLEAAIQDHNEKLERLSKRYPIHPASSIEGGA